MMSFQLQVPTLPPSDLLYCDFIQISYSLKFHAYGAVMVSTQLSMIHDKYGGTPRKRI